MVLNMLLRFQPRALIQFLAKKETKLERPLKICLSNANPDRQVENWELLRLKSRIKRCVLTIAAKLLSFSLSPVVQNPVSESEQRR